MNIKDVLEDIFSPLGLSGAKGAGRALRRGVPKDPSYIAKEPFFVNGKARNEGIYPTVPYRLEPHPPIDPDSEYAERFKTLSVENLKVPHLDTPGGKLKPSYVHDQYLKNVEGGAKNLVAQAQENYLRDAKDLPWKQDVAMRDKEVIFKTQTGNPDVGSHYNSKTQEATFSPYDPTLLANGRKYNGFPAGKESLSFYESIMHEVSHAMTYDPSGGSDAYNLKEAKRMYKDYEGPRRGRDIDTQALNRPYFYASSEEYKVGSLTFLNKSRQLTGQKLMNPQEIHQLFDEIEKDPSILDKNYTLEEARLPRTYLLLKEKNPQAAEVLRNATARDCQYLAKAGMDRSKVAGDVSKLVAKGPKEVDPSILGAMSQVSNLGLSDGGIESPENSGKVNRLAKRLLEPVENWVNQINQKGKELYKSQEGMVMA
jgi:hypothetical protein